jgi:hypothetical protein
MSRVSRIDFPLKVAETGLWRRCGRKRADSDDPAVFLLRSRPASVATIHVARGWGELADGLDREEAL